MSRLPPLQTVRRPGEISTPAPPPLAPVAAPPPAGFATATIAATPSPAATSALQDRAAWPALAAFAPAARPLLTELGRLGYLTEPALEAWRRALGPRAPQLNSRERLVEALVGGKVVPRYVATRVLNGQTHGLVFGNYRVRERLGSGSVGVVFRAEHTTLGRQVAVKALPLPDDAPPGAADRFWREAAALAKLRHPSLVAVLDAGTVEAPAGSGEPALCYLVLELAESGDLEQHVYERGPRPPEEALRWGRELAEGLSYAHTAGVIHRDVKPSNVFLTGDGRAVLADFGLARDFGSTATEPGALLGSLQFLAPEQWHDAATAAEPADVYSLGVTLFWTLTGKLPGDAPESKAGPPAPATRRLREVNADLPEALDALLGRMLAKSPAGRPTAAQVASELAAVAGGLADPRAEADALRQSLRQWQARAGLGQSATFDALAAALAERPGQSRAAQERVGSLTRVIAQQLATNPEWVALADPRAVADLERAARVCDLGYLGLPDELLTAAATGLPLSEAERAALGRHPRLGARLLDRLAESHADALPGLRMARGVVEYHHARPDQVAAGSIPPGARVVAAALAFDALRPDGDFAGTVAKVRAEAGKSLDSDVAAALAECAEECERVWCESHGIVADLVAVDGAG